jgi:SAM-dependent methyltransferase
MAFSAQATSGAWRCPTCKGALADTGEGELACARCGSRWSAARGVPRFTRLGYRFGVGELDRAADDGDGALTEAPMSEDMRRWLAHPGRADAALLAIDDPAQAVVLDAGCGWGGLSFPLARWVREVHAVDPTVGAADEVGARAAREGVTNVIAANADLFALPFADATFDAVIVNGVLEWVPVSRADVSPREAQRLALVEAARVLKPGGRLYLAMENRFALRYLAGARDEHTGLRWLTPLPRALADLYHRACKGGTPYRCWTQSVRELERLMREARLEVRSVWGPLRDYRVFRFVVPLAPRPALELLAARGMPFPSFEGRVFVALAKLVVALGSPRILVELLFPSVALVGERPR